MFEQYDDMVTAEEAAEMLAIGKNAVYKLLASGEIKCFRHHRIWKIPKQSIIDYIHDKSKF